MKIKGFSLIELLIAITIISLLAVTAGSFYPQMVRRTARTEAMHQLSIIREAQLAHCAENPTDCQWTAIDPAPYNYPDFAGLPWNVPAESKNFDYTIQSNTGTMEANCKRAGWPNFRMNIFDATVVEF